MIDDRIEERIEDGIEDGSEEMKKGKSAGQSKGKTARKSAIDTAADYIGLRPRTVAETRRKLKEKGYEDEEIESAIASMIDYKYLDDYSYCISYFRYAYSKQRGRRRIVRELAEKGVDRELIETAYDDYCAEENGEAYGYENGDENSYENGEASGEARIDEYAMALEIARKEIAKVAGRGLTAEASDEEDEEAEETTVNRKSKYKVDEKLVARIGRKLDSRGFAMDDIYRVLSEIRRWKDTEDIEEQ